MSTRVLFDDSPIVPTRGTLSFFRGYGRIHDIVFKNGVGFVESKDHRDADDTVYEVSNIFEVLMREFFFSVEVIDDHSSYCCCDIKSCSLMLMLCSLLSFGLQYHFTGEYLEVKAIFPFLNQEGLYANDHVRMDIAAWQFGSLALLVTAMVTWKRFLLVPFCLMQVALIICDSAIFSTCLVCSALDKIDNSLEDRLRLIGDMFFPEATDIAVLHEPIVLGIISTSIVIYSQVIVVTSISSENRQHRDGSDLAPQQRLTSFGTSSRGLRDSPPVFRCSTEAKVFSIN